MIGNEGKRGTISYEIAGRPKVRAPDDVVPCRRANSMLKVHIVRIPPLFELLRNIPINPVIIKLKLQIRFGREPVSPTRKDIPAANNTVRSGWPIGSASVQISLNSQRALVRQFGIDAEPPVVHFCGIACISAVGKRQPAAIEILDVGSVISPP